MIVGQASAAPLGARLVERVTLENSIADETDILHIAVCMGMKGSIPDIPAHASHKGMHLDKRDYLMSITTGKTASQVRSAAKDGKAQKIRRRATWLSLPCYLCTFPMYWGRDRTGYAPDDATIGHNYPHALGGTYAAENTHPACRTCNVATGTRDLTGMVPHGPAWVSIAEAMERLNAETDDDYTRTGIGASERNRSRKARFGW